MLIKNSLKIVAITYFLLGNIVCDVLPGVHVTGLVMILSIGRAMDGAM